MNDVSTLTLRMFVEHPLDVPVLYWVLSIIILTFVGAFVYLQCKNDSLDLRWLIMERPHKPSLPKIGQVTALIASTWIFIVLGLKGQLSETYFMCYMTVWSGSAALETYFNKGNRGERRAGDDPQDNRGTQ